MRIAILGAGFAGLGLAWHLLNFTKGTARVDIFDPAPIGANASGISLGLLHSYGGKRANKALYAERALEETHNCLTVSSQALRESVILSNGILRPATTDEQIEDFSTQAFKNKDTEWWDKEKCEQSIPNLIIPENGGGMFINSGLTVDTTLYLHGLWQACAHHGAIYNQTMEIPEDYEKKYDVIVIALGGASNIFPSTTKLPITPVRGQILAYERPPQVSILPHSLAGTKQLVTDIKSNYIFIGATYERDFKDLKPNLSIAQRDLLPKIESFFPIIKVCKLYGSRIGLRSTTPDHHPLIGRADDKHWFLTGLGSKGLLYHALAAKALATAILDKGNLMHIPKEFLWDYEKGIRGHS